MNHKFLICLLIIFLHYLPYSTAQEFSEVPGGGLNEGQWLSSDRENKNMRFKIAVFHHLKMETTNVFVNYKQIIAAWEVIRAEARVKRKSNRFIENAPRVVDRLAYLNPSFFPYYYVRASQGLFDKTLNGSKAALANAATPIYNLLFSQESVDNLQLAKFASQLYYSEQVMLQEVYYGILTEKEKQELSRFTFGWLAFFAVPPLFEYLPRFTNYDGDINILSDRLCYGQKKLCIEDYRKCIGLESPCEVPDSTGGGITIDIPIIRAIDPNEIIGPAGVGPEKWVGVENDLPYTILFENDPDFATASAQKVIIRHSFDDSVNPFSLRLGDFGFGDYVFPIPEGTSFYRDRIDLVDTMGLLLDVAAGIDVERNEVFWIFESKDPATGLANTLPAELGFLPVNDTTLHNGEGFVNFRIRPYLSSQTGDLIEAEASIIFDDNAPINTNMAINTIDASRPESGIISVVPNEGEGTYTLDWEGSDIGAGIRNYTLHVATNNGPFIPIVSNLEGSPYTFTGSPDSMYQFFTRAIDQVDNEESLKGSGEPACMQIAILQQLNELNNLSNGLIEVQLTGQQGSLEYEWSHDVNLNGPIADGLATGSYVLTVRDEIGCELNLTIQIENDFSTPVEEAQPTKDLLISSLFPVPAADELFIDFWSSQVEVDISLLDMQGRVLLKRSIQATPQAQNRFRLDLQDIPLGMYWVRLNSAGSWVNGVFVKGRK